MSEFRCYFLTDTPAVQSPSEIASVLRAIAADVEKGQTKCALIDHTARQIGAWECA